MIHFVTWYCLHWQIQFVPHNIITKHVFKLTLICAQVLKEEIRKFQRSEERKKHIENSEYVKNIILKVRRSVSMSLKFSNGSEMVSY